MPEKCAVVKCSNQVDFFNGKKCKFCQNPYCFEHIQFEKHDCVKTTPTKYIRKTWLRKYLVNVSSGRYIVVCDECGYVSEISSLIDLADQERKQHIQTSGCDGKRVFLEEDLSDQKIPSNIQLENVIPHDRKFFVCCHCRPPKKFTDRNEYISHHFIHS